jgi:hypothetical protein
VDPLTVGLRVFASFRQFLEVFDRRLQWPLFANSKWEREGSKPIYMCDIRAFEAGRSILFRFANIASSLKKNVEKSCANERRQAKPNGKENRGMGGGSWPHGMEEKLSSPPRHSALACRARLPYTLRRDPWGSEASPGLHRHRGGPNFKNAPAVTREEVCTH